MIVDDRSVNMLLDRRFIGNGEVLQIYQIVISGRWTLILYNNNMDMNIAHNRFDNHSCSLALRNRLGGVSGISIIR